MIQNTVGKNWTGDFVRRHKDALKSTYLRNIDKQRTKAEYLPSFEHFYQLVIISVFSICFILHLIGHLANIGFSSVMGSKNTISPPTIYIIGMRKDSYLVKQVLRSEYWVQKLLNKAESQTYSFHIVISCMKGAMQSKSLMAARKPITEDSNIASRLPNSHASAASEWSASKAALLVVPHSLANVDSFESWILVRSPKRLA